MTTTIFFNAKLEGFLVANVGSAEAEEALAIVRELVDAEREACCQLVYSNCSSDNVAERTVRAIRARGKT